MRHLVLCAGLACATAPGIAAESAAADPAAAIPDAGRLLVQSAHASRTRNYQGVVIYRGDDRFDVLRVQHRFQNDSERERLIALTGEPRQVVRVDNRLICVQPKGQSASVHRPSLKGFLTQMTDDRVGQLKAWYRFESAGEGRIAGRLCDGVTIRPKDQYRYGYEIWTDRETRLPLKVSLTGPEGQVLEQLMFTEVSFPESIPDAAFEAEVDVNRFNLVARDLPELDALQNLPPHAEPQVVFGRLPPGFKVVSHDDRALPDGSGNVEHLLLSDGLSSVSVFSTVRSRQEKVLSGVSHMGPVQAYGKVVGSFHVTIVGEVPGPAIRLIGDNLRVPLPGQAETGAGLDGGTAPTVTPVTREAPTPR